MAEDTCLVNGRHRGKCKMVAVRNAEHNILAWACRKGMVAHGRQHFHSPKRVNKKRCNVKEMSLPFRERLT